MCNSSWWEETKADKQMRGDERPPQLTRGIPPPRLANHNPRWTLPVSTPWHDHDSGDDDVVSVAIPHQPVGHMHGFPWKGSNWLSGKWGKWQVSLSHGTWIKPRLRNGGESYPVSAIWGKEQNWIQIPLIIVEATNAHDAQWSGHLRDALKFFSNYNHVTMWLSWHGGRGLLAFQKQALRKQALQKLSERKLSKSRLSESSPKAFQRQTIWKQAPRKLSDSKLTFVESSTNRDNTTFRNKIAHVGGPWKMLGVLPFGEDPAAASTLAY